MNVQSQNNTLHPNTYHVFVSYAPHMNNSPFGMNFMNDSHEMIMSILGDELDNFLDGNDENYMSTQELEQEISDRLTMRFKEEILYSLERFIESINFRVQRSPPSRTIMQPNKNYNELVCKIKSTKKNVKELGLNTNDGDSIVCPICLDVLKYNRIWHHPKNCNHVFHPHCLKKFVNYNRSNNISCPVCRENM